MKRYGHEKQLYLFMVLRSRIVAEALQRARRRAPRVATARPGATEYRGSLLLPVFDRFSCPDLYMVLRAPRVATARPGARPGPRRRSRQGPRSRCGRGGRRPRGPPSRFAGAGRSGAGRPGQCKETGARRRLPQPRGCRVAGRAAAMLWTNGRLQLLSCHVASLDAPQLSMYGPKKL